ncbi:hypothetical protein [Streptomyces griseosporeus]|uniref:hypothetical protein n=1 Tax=Streptomyces griseosporeus TaxID=1910 RepID=UPI00167CF8C9|nr:hypothetical protein [Streptomyces griseosporeus]GHF77854.1 hypothetical protein GCM10018783_55060 [Streptomyces griseosporeus]
MPPLLQYTAIVIGLPVLAWALWSSARLARANRNGTAGMDVSAYGLLPREELDASEYGPIAPEVADATLAARQGDWRPGAALLAATGQDWDRRWYVLTRLAQVAPQEDAWLTAWRTERPGDPDAAAVHAQALLYLAWHARGEGYAENTPADRLARFKQLLQAAFEEARSAAALAPHDPSPWVTMVTAARGLVLPHEEFRRLWSELTARAPHHFYAHLNALQYWCAKWCGSDRMAHRFAQEAAASAPPQSLLSVLPLEAAFERALQGAGQVPLAGRHPKSELDAVRAALSAVPADDPRSRLVRHRLAAALTLAGKGSEALEHFRILEPWVGGEPWSYHGNPVAMYDRARALAIVKAGSGLRRQRKPVGAPLG